MPDLKTCPFCLEEIPVKAIKCRYCESMVDDIPPTAVPSAKSKEPAERRKGKKPIPPRQDMYYQAVSEKKKGKRFLVPLVVVAALLILLGAGAGYWFLLYDTGEPATVGVNRDFVLGSWRGTSANNEVYFQFLPNEMVNVAVPPEDYWFRTQFRVVVTGTDSYLELYHSGKDEWERTAELVSGDERAFTMIDTWDNIRIEMERISDSEFRDVINELRFER